MWCHDWTSDSLEGQIVQDLGSALPAVAQAAVVRWPLPPSLHPRCRVQDLEVPEVEQGLRLLGHQLENQFISMRAVVHVLEGLLCPKFS